VPVGFEIPAYANRCSDSLGDKPFVPKVRKRKSSNNSSKQGWVAVIGKEVETTAKAGSAR